VWREDPACCAAHRALVRRVIRQHALGLAWTVYAQGASRAAAAAVRYSLRVDPQQKRAYAMLVLAWLRSLAPGREAPPNRPDDGRPAGGPLQVWNHVRSARG